MAGEWKASPDDDFHHEDSYIFKILQQVAQGREILMCDWNFSGCWRELENSFLSNLVGDVDRAARRC